jgi:CheY-like chemotaxis protein
MTDRETGGPDLLHQLKNQLAVVIGYCDLLLSECPDTDPRRLDIAEMQKAGRTAMTLIEEFSRRMRDRSSLRHGGLMATSTPQPVVFVVDDEAAVRRVARRILETDGYRVIEATNGAEAVKLLTEDMAVDLLMADLDMPELTGEEMARQLRAKRPDLKVLYVTGKIDRLFTERPVLWEGEAFLEKPFTAEGLLEAVSLQLYGTLKKKKV